MKSAKDIFEHYLCDNGVRYSAQREKIADIFLKTEKHLTVAEFYQLVRKKYPGIGYATVYRAMKVICDAGLAEKSDFGDGTMRFEHKYGHDHHDHLVCLDCGSFTEVVDPKIERRQDMLAREHGFEPQWHKMQIFGICKKCSKKRKAANT